MEWQRNVIMQIQPHGLTFHMFFLVSKPKEISNNSQIIIQIACAGMAKVNLDATNHLIMCEGCFRHGRNYVYDISKYFYIIK